TACHVRARTGRKPRTFTSTRTTTKPVLTSVAAVEFRPGINMVRRRSTVRFRNGAPERKHGGILAQALTEVREQEDRHEREVPQRRNRSGDRGRRRPPVAAG